ncbi:hypothetical protein K7X08_030601 [Anisodus acutangulus]|uniref:Sugar phosphate transporter domain-containing protein n=1 Tax=Anisodus acutangulus TaxID=402998 RepID=A0A9Q1MWP9_9SOLA|nr:hypothetical protein K7X08_030601 [Anisodus acutangulus]
MAFSAGQSYAVSTTFDPLQQYFLSSKPHISSFSFKELNLKQCEKHNIVSRKPLYISAVLSGFGHVDESKESKSRDTLVQCNAYEASRPQSVPIGIEFGQEAQAAAAQKLKIGMSKVAVSFTHIIKSGEPTFSVFVSRLLGETFPLPVYLSLLPIIGGCALAAITELNFNLTGFMGAMISNMPFVFRNICSKKGMKRKSVGGMNYYACLSMMSLLILTPFAIAVEGPQCHPSSSSKFQFNRSMPLVLPLQSWELSSTHSNLKFKGEVDEKKRK